MAYTNKVPVAAAVTTAVLFLLLTFAPRWTEAQQLPSMPKINPVCAFLDIPKTVQLCYLSGNLAPSGECCDDLKSAIPTKVTCLCDNFITLPSNSNFTGALFDVVHSACGVADKFACKGGSTNGGSNNGGSNNGGGTDGGSTHGGGTDGGSTHGGGTKGGGTNGGATNKIAATMSLFGLVANLFFFLIH